MKQNNQSVTCDRCGDIVDKDSKHIVNHCLEKQHFFVARQVTERRQSN